MKRAMILLAALGITLPALAGDDKPIGHDRLPVKAKEFIARHFSGTAISLATVDKELFDTTYEVFFTNGSKVEFARDGQWKDIDCKYGRVPEAAVPEKIRSYITTHYGGSFVKEIDRDRYDYEVKLDNGFELKFDLAFNLVGIDD